MQLTIDELGQRLGLMALGYRRVLYIHLYCVTHGLFRSGVEDEQEYYPCPVCTQACKVAILAEGYTRRPLPLLPEMIVGPLGSFARALLWTPERVLAEIPTLPSKICRACGQEFTPERGNTRLCSRPECERHREQSRYQPKKLRQDSIRATAGNF